MISCYVSNTFNSTPMLDYASEIVTYQRLDILDPRKALHAVFSTSNIKRFCAALSLINRIIAEVVGFEMAHVNVNICLIAFLFH